METREAIIDTTPIGRNNPFVFIAGQELRQLAIREGMTTLLQDGILKVLRGHTGTFKQVRAVCIK